MPDQGNITAANAGDLNTAARMYAALKGWAMRDGSYPIRPANMHGEADLKKAIKAVGRGGASHDAIRRHIIKRARALGLAEAIPDNWSSDGSMRGVDMAAEVERRFTPGMVEVRTAGDAKRIGGYAAVFGKLSRNLGGFVEVVEQGAFNQARSLGWPDVVARYNHDPNMLLGTTAGRTLELAIHDGAGLWYDVLPPTARADITELVQRGDVRHSSFAFRAMEDEWSKTDQGYPLRSLHEVKLVDVAPVLIPAYPDTTAQERALEAALVSLAEHVEAPLEEVRSLAARDELRSFFTRSDKDGGKPAKPATPPMFGPAARAALREREQDPWVNAG